MKDHITKEFIEACKEAQPWIEPEVGMWVVTDDFEEGDRAFLIDDMSDDDFLECGRSVPLTGDIYWEEDYILLPDLGRLVRKLEEYFGKSFNLCVSSVGGWFAYGNKFGLAFHWRGNTPEIACIMLLNKIWDYENALDKK